MRVKVLTLFVALISLLGGLLSSTAAAALDEPPPPSTPGRTGPPSSIAVLGDSISTATGTGTLGGETPNNSWSTGLNAAVNSTYQRLLAINPAISGNRANMASNGRRMVHMAEQAAAMPATTEYVEVALGGNDLCRPTVAEMTSVEDYRAQFVAGLAAIAQRAPDALISAYTIPDIFNLWYIRYAPASYNGQESPQAGWARTYVNLSVIPCLALLENPASVSEADMNRRFEVRARNMAFNEVIIEECEKVLRCRHDGGATFDLSSNRGPDGEYLPRSEWRFVDEDISRNTGSLCPVSGAFAPGCGDHFHPSLAGQAKLAEGAWLLGRDWTDGVAPEVTVTPPTGTGPVVITATDDGGVRGIEHRVDGGAWEATLGDGAEVDLPPGTHHLEVRALDVDGNLSDSQVVTVTVPDPSVNTPPVAHAGEDQTVDFGATVGLDGSASSDVDHDELTFSWVQTDGPSVSLSDSSSATPSFVAPDGPATLTFELTVWDGTASDTASVTVNVVAPVSVDVVGSVTAPVDPAGTQVYAVPASAAWPLAAAPVEAATSTSGTFAFDALPTDDYQFLVIPTAESRLLARWIGGDQDRSGAGTYTVTSGDLLTLPVTELTVAGAIAGTVTDSAGAGIAGTTVRVYGSGDTWLPRVETTTGPDGTYTVPAVVDGEYRVLFVPPAGSGLINQWYEGTTERATATPVVVSGSAVTSSVDAELAGGRSLSGVVTGPGGTPVAGVWVMAYSATDTWVGSVWAFTDAEGRYALEGVPTGTYRVYFVPPAGSGLAAEWYDDAPKRAAAVPLAVAPGAPIGAVDAVLAPA